LARRQISSPTLTVAGLRQWLDAVWRPCQTCHESAPTRGCSRARPARCWRFATTGVDKTHPTSGDCGGATRTTPTFSYDVTSSAKPATSHSPHRCVRSSATRRPATTRLYSVTVATRASRIDSAATARRWRRLCTLRSPRSRAANYDRRPRPATVRLSYHQLMSARAVSTSAPANIKTRPYADHLQRHPPR